MDTKTKIEVTQDTNQCQLKKGTKGYIDGYVQLADGRPYAVVVCGEIIDLVPVWALKAI